ncbi:MAG: SDR family oxidoreductase [Caulobacteraceae bacterium]
MSIIVTGATGNFGSEVTALLMEQVGPEALILITRKPERLAHLAAKGATVRRGDFDDPASLPAAFEGGERMLLISTARVGSRVGQHGNAITAAAKVGVKQIAYTSFIGVQGDNPAIVTKDHRATEELMRASGTGWTALRDSQYSEAAAQVMAPQFLPSGKWVSNSGDGQIAMVSRADCVACAAAVLTTPGHVNKAYDITGPALISFRDICEMVSEISGKALEYIPITDEEMYGVFDAAGVPREASDDPVNAAIPWCSDDMVSFSRAIREGHFAIISDHVQRLLGRPPVTLRSVLEKYADTWPV